MEWVKTLLKLVTGLAVGAIYNDKVNLAVCDKQQELQLHKSRTAKLSFSVNAWSHTRKRREFGLLQRRRTN